MFSSFKTYRRASVGLFSAGLLLGLMGAYRLDAQATAGIVGTVTDATGAVIA